MGGKRARRQAREEASAEADPSEAADEAGKDSGKADQYADFDGDEGVDPLVDLGRETAHHAGERKREERWYDVVERKLAALPQPEGKDRRTWAGVFDRRTMMTLYKFISNGVIDQMDFGISTGKEADVFRASTPEETHICVKIYRTNVSSFHEVLQYIQGDPRFQGIKRERHGLVLAWAQKEYRNLGRAIDAGVHVPQPISILNNVLLMEYIGNESDDPAPLIKDVALERPEEVRDRLLDDYHLLLTKGRLVHADFSEFNILWGAEGPVIIDVGQAVLVEHPMAAEFFDRDVRNMTRWFGRIGAEMEEAEVRRQILGPDYAHFQDLL